MRSRRSLKVSHTQTSVPQGTLNSLSLPEGKNKTYLHKYTRTLSAIETESSKAKSEIWPDTRHKNKKLMDLVKTLRLQACLMRFSKE